MFVAADIAELLVAVLSVPSLVLVLWFLIGFLRGDVDDAVPKSFLTERPRRRKS